MMLATIEFTDRELALIQKALPANVTSQRAAMLPRILREWAQTDLGEHLARRQASLAASRRSQAAVVVGRRHRASLDAADNLDAKTVRRVIAEMALADAPQETMLSISDEALAAATQQYHEHVRLLAEVTAAAERAAQRPGRGQPRNLVSYLVLSDLAAIFEYMTGREAKRTVDRIEHEEAGPFHAFAAAIWPVIFGQGDDGLPAAMRNWAEGSKKFGERSAVVANIALRYPEWGLFDE